MIGVAADPEQTQVRTDAVGLFTFGLGADGRLGHGEQEDDNVHAREAGRGVGGCRGSPGLREAPPNTFGFARCACAGL